MREKPFNHLKKALSNHLGVSFDDTLILQKKRQKRMRGKCTLWKNINDSHRCQLSARFLIRDDEQLYSTAKECISNNRCFIPNEVLAEVVFVLLKVYKVTKEEIKSTVIQLIQHDNMLIDSKPSLVRALEIFNDKNLDFVDAILCAKSTDYEIRTFDRKLQKCIAECKN